MLKESIEKVRVAREQFNISKELVSEIAQSSLNITDLKQAGFKEWLNILKLIEAVDYQTCVDLLLDAYEGVDLTLVGINQSHMNCFAFHSHHKQTIDWHNPNQVNVVNEFDQYLIERF